MAGYQEQVAPGETKRTHHGFDSHYDPLSGHKIKNKQLSVTMQHQLYSSEKQRETMGVPYVYELDSPWAPETCTFLCLQSPYGIQRFCETQMNE